MTTRTTALERRLLRFAGDCAPLLRVVPQSTERWVAVGRNRQTIRSRPNVPFTIALALSTAKQTCEAMPSHRELARAYKRDPVFGGAARLAGHWGRFETVLARVMGEGCALRSGKVVVQPERLLAALRAQRSLFASSAFHYDCTARLFGVAIPSKTVVFADGIELHRLSLPEVNRRQPVVHAFVPTPHRVIELPQHRTEARFRVSVPVDRERDLAFFAVNNEARALASAQMQLVADALSISLSADITYGSLELRGGFDQGTGTTYSEKPVSPSQAKLSRTLRDDAVAVHGLIKAPAADPILSGAIHRILLGLRRRNPVDRLVDLCIAWEMVLLTQRGEQVNQELSYRFAVNGALLISASGAKAERRDTFRRLRAVYSARSAVVHGASADRLKQALKPGGFADLDAANAFSQSALRRIVLHLSGIQPQERPYRKEGGWESLLWN